MNAPFNPATPHRSWQEHERLTLLSMAAPRYTSYPSAHHFTDLSADTYGDWLSRLDRDTSIALYAHIPFCEQMCHFCGCHTRVTRRYEPVFDYVSTLIREIELVAARIGFRPKVHSLHLGGGSPSILNRSDFARLMEAFDSAFVFLPNAEKSMELDPRRVDRDKVTVYRDYGINRVSLGVQDTDPEVQKSINRIQPFEVIMDAFTALRDGGLTAIGLDLVYGLPHQDTQSIIRTMEHVRLLDPDRISVFSYAHVPWMKKHQTLIDETTLPGPEAKVAAFDQISTALETFGYDIIGLDHFAKPEDGLARAACEGRLRRNFMGYVDSPNDILLGFGASSIGETSEGIAQNISQPTTWRTRIEAGQLATQRGWVYHGDDEVRKALISDIMCHFKVDAGAIAFAHGYAIDYFDTDIAGLDDLKVQNIVHLEERRLIFTASLRQLIRAVACRFDTYAKAAQTKTGPSYSRVA